MRWLLLFFHCRDWKTGGRGRLTKGQSPYSHQVCLIPKPGVVAAVLCGLHIQEVVGNTAFLGMEYVQGCGVEDPPGKDL